MDIINEYLDKAINKRNSEDKIALATIYNTVHAFKKAGHLKEILIKDGKNYFDTNTSSHHHFYDEVNNELTDIEDNKIELVEKQVLEKKTIINSNEVDNVIENLEYKSIDSDGNQYFNLTNTK